MLKYTTLNHSNLSFFQMNDFKENLDWFKKRNLKYIFGCYSKKFKEIMIIGNSEKINLIIEVINHEVLHNIIDNTLGLTYEEFFIHNKKYDHEYIVNTLTNKLQRKIHDKLDKFFMLTSTKR